jgi:F-type H+-transporting ATPase subunit epsilon
MSTINVTLVTPNGIIFDGEASSVVLPGKEGEFGVYPEHVSLVSLLDAGVIEIRKPDGKVESVVIDWGYAKVNEDSVDVLIDKAVPISGSDDSEIAKAIEQSKQLLKDITDSNVMISVLESKIDSIAKSKF